MNLRQMIKRIFGKRKSTESMLPKTSVLRDYDPLDPIERTRAWTDSNEGERVLPMLRDVKSFPMVELQDSEGRKVKTINGKTLAMDSAPVARMYVADDYGTCDPRMTGGMQTPYAVPEQLMNWYVSQSFIGYQACALIAQQWLVDKACSMAGEDAVRNGWTLKAMSEDDELDDETSDMLTRHDEEFKLTENLKQFSRFKNIFGIRVAIFEVDSDDPEYYAKPFNIDGVTLGSYKGISQVDPYWMMPMLTSESTSDPSSMHFYEPEFWIISGKKYHRSHLVIIRCPEPADILKPTYIFGGVPLTQRIYERVYAAERTANEAPLLAMNKRTTAIHVDTEKAVLNEDKFIEKLKFWVKFRDNHAVKVLGKEETMEQFDTSLADFDAVIMNQFQLVAAIAETPATKILGTSPKGFSSTGEFEAVSYHEKLESVQKHDMSPMLDRHYLLSEKSLGLSVQIQHVWEAVDSMTAVQRADLNLKRAQTGDALVGSGAISSDEERNRIRDDKHSGYNRLSTVDANEEPGMSPEALAKLETAGAKNEQAGAAVTVAGAKSAEAGEPAAKGAQEGVGLPASVAAVPEVQEPAKTNAAQQETTMLDPASSQAMDPAVLAILSKMADVVERLSDRMVPEGQGVANGTVPGKDRSVLPGINPSIAPSVTGAHQVAAELPPWKLPKMKLHGLTLAIENPRGSNRRGMDMDGKQWSVNMPHHYGFIKGVKGADGDELDCFVGTNMKADNVFVVNQNDMEGEFDEHKCMMGFDDEESAKAAYMSAFSADWNGFGSIVQLPVDKFKDWISSGECNTPLNKNCIAQTEANPYMSGSGSDPDVIAK